MFPENASARILHEWVTMRARIRMACDGALPGLGVQRSSRWHPCVTDNVGSPCPSGDQRLESRRVSIDRSLPVEYAGEGMMPRVWKCSC
jgi:hypothetical protein